MRAFVWGISVVVLIHVQQGQCQELRVTSGAGLPDGIHVGVLYSITEVNELGLSAGTIPDLSDIFILQLEHRYIFGHSKHRSSPTWFTSQRIAYWDETNGVDYWQQIVTTLSIGSNIYIGKRFGLTIDGGIFVIAYSITDNQESYADLPPVLPSLRIQFFLR